LESWPHHQIFPLKATPKLLRCLDHWIRNYLCSYIVWFSSMWVLCVTQNCFTIKLFVSQESRNTRRFSFSTKHIDHKAISWSATQARLLLHLFTFLIGKSCGMQGSILTSKISIEVPKHKKGFYFSHEEGMRNYGLFLKANFL